MVYVNLAESIYKIDQGRMTKTTRINCWMELTQRNDVAMSSILPHIPVDLDQRHNDDADGRQLPGAAIC